MKKISELVLYKDHHLIALNKPAGMPANEDPSGHPSAHRLAMAYAHRDLYVVHRLDRRVSGVIVFAKTKSTAAALSKLWEQKKVKKIYLALVQAVDIPPVGQLLHYLTYDNEKNITYTHDAPLVGADEAILQYQVLQQLDHYLLVRIDLISGRKHQIRAQMAAIGAPVRGDIKYGARRTTQQTGIDLHAFKLQFLHPTRQEYIKIIAPVPDISIWPEIDQRVLEEI